ncbi:hypothetical protein WMF39_36850 [Sorangium sp. So ce1504]|uniref:hypothetical protein n=1 Tax=Sorangium sp. So ce1504 TaxID=3133337 RepID=UPI003F6024C0
MRGLLARSALGAPVLAALALSALPARADGPRAADAAAARAGGPRITAAPAARADGPRASAAPWAGFPAQPLARAYAPLRAADPWFGDDKMRHFCASIALAGGGYALGALATSDLRQRLALGAAVALGAGLAKEVYDAAGHGTPSARDVVWDALGTSAGLGLSLWFDLAATPIQF